MRAIFYVLALVLIFMPQLDHAAERKHEKSLLSRRGFKAGRCYRHPSVRRCQANGNCFIELFSGTVSQLRMPLLKLQYLIKGKATVDYGLVTFRLKARKGIPKVEIIKVKRVRLKDWNKVQDRSQDASPVKCD